MYLQSRNYVIHSGIRSHLRQKKHERSTMFWGYFQDLRSSLWFILFWGEDRNAWKTFLRFSVSLCAMYTFSNASHPNNRNRYQWNGWSCSIPYPNIPFDVFRIDPELPKRSECAAPEFEMRIDIIFPPALICCRTTAILPTRFEPWFSDSTLST